MSVITESVGWVADKIGLGGGGDDAAAAAREAAGISAGAQTEALEYLKEREALPQQFREEALGRLGGIYGLPGGTGSEEQMIQSLMASPLYKAILGGREAGEESILRSAAATGGLRSGDVQSNLYDYNVQLENKALLDAYNQRMQGLSGMANLPSAAPQIAQGMAGIGQTQAQGITAAEQARQAGSQMGLDNLLGLGSMAVGMFSDRRLKTDIQPIGEIDGHKWYSWKWNTVAEKMGLKGETIGVMADEVRDKQPEAVSLNRGFMFIDYGKLEAI
jgi:hypothetical protein